MTPGSKNGELWIYFDEDFDMIMANAARHKEQILMTEEDGQLTAEISFMTMDGEEVYGLSVVHTLRTAVNRPVRGEEAL